MKIKILPGSFNLLSFFFILSFTLLACMGSGNKNEKAQSGKINNHFHPDSAYFHLQKQVSFGPRIPSSKAHKKTVEYLKKTLEKEKFIVSIQQATALGYDGSKQNIRNIIGVYNAQQEKRILLSAHYDTRPFADQEDIKKTLDGANDGASGVAVLLEIARQINILKLKIGIDIIFWDQEDGGTPLGKTSQQAHPTDYYCLGSEYWSKNPHKKNYKAIYGINLDMVGAKNAKYFFEGFSNHYASHILEWVWKVAKEQGYGSVFSKRKVGSIVDDHYFVNTYGIPCINIIHLVPTYSTRFFKHWHTSKDNLSIIDKNSLKIVGDVVLEVLNRENEILQK